MKPLDIRIRKVLATNSLPTLEVEIETERGVVSSSAPMGTSTGKYEAQQLPVEDCMKKFKFLRRMFVGRDFKDLKEVDTAIRASDGTSGFRIIGGNLATAMSYAFLKAFAMHYNTEVWRYVAWAYRTAPRIPQPLCNVAGGWKGQSDFQEFLFLPVHQRSFADSVFRISEAYRDVESLLSRADGLFTHAKNLESGWVTSLGYGDVLKIMTRVANTMFLKIGIDVAASQIFKNGHYHYRSGHALTPQQHFALLNSVVNTYPVSYIEDPFQEDDWENFSNAVGAWQPRMVCGDDFYATKVQRLLSSVDRRASNAAIVKPNQVGTVSGAVEFALEAQSRGLITVMSHRSGETDDALISHLAVALGCDYVKFGISGERIVKLNEILRIEDSVLRPARRG